MSNSTSSIWKKFSLSMNRHSIEGVLGIFILACVLLIFSLSAVILWQNQASTLAIFTALTVFLVPFILFCLHVRKRLLTPYYKFSAVLEAVRNEDYSLRANPKFNQGAVKVLADEVSLMAQDLQARKSHYDQQAILVLRLIEQLATPIAIFSHDGKLYHGNDALSVWCNQPWLSLKHTSASELGFTQQNDKWQLCDKSLTAKWQLRHSQFTMQDELFQLVVLTNIEQVVYQTEQSAWQKMTRVLSHEINNSLSPIKSLAQTLQDMLSESEQKQSIDPALQVIIERSDGLMQFVNRYASLSQQYDVNCEDCDILALFKAVSELFDYTIEVELGVNSVKADKVLLEQILVNLVKNAIESTKQPAPITLCAHKDKGQIVISVIDNGSGVQNPDNLFVPFYTTKAQGKGIGLSLCRNMMEQQNGKLTLSNRLDAQGAIAQCLFPDDLKR